MDVFTLRDQLVVDYRRYVSSFMALRDDRIRERVQSSLEEGRLWPEPSVGLNPSFAPGGWIDELATEGLLDVRAADIFRADKSTSNPRGRPMRLHRHQVDAIRQAHDGNDYVLTTGTGSGKSLAYIVPIVDHVLRVGSGGGIKAVVVYPMNALANSQHKELEKFLVAGLPPGAGPAVRFARYTGQEQTEDREQVLTDPPDVLLTNYVMLELILTRVRDRRLVRAMGNLRFLVLDELHTYRGRQGADVALLVRRLREASRTERLQCVGTSATLSTGGTLTEQQRAVAAVASQLFGATVASTGVVGETLQRSTPALDDRDPAVIESLRRIVEVGGPAPTAYEAVTRDPLTSWIETTFGVEEVNGRLVRARPLAITGKGGGAESLAELTGSDLDRCAFAIRARLMAGYEARHPETGFPVFAFRLHQFISKGDTVFASPEPEDQRYLTLEGQRFVPGHRDTVLLPLAFCRQCGQEYYSVHRIATEDDGPSTFVPRDLGDRSHVDQSGHRQAPGFLYLSAQQPWPDDPDLLVERLPEDWLEEKATGTKVKADQRRWLPVPLRVDKSATVIESGGTPAWWVPVPFRLCLACGVSYGSRLASDHTKLTTLGSEGRSTATTVLSLSAVRALRGDDTLDARARKLLSFTDNRQDASLQAGHFNDFVQVALLRGALHAAAVKAGGEGLEHDEVVAATFAALDLPFALYAVDAEVEFHARTETERALRDALGYRLYLDLRRGWRVNQPNLEQCGLLELTYNSLDEACAADHLWSDKHEALATASPAERRAVATTLLDFLRRELAIKVDYLDRDYLEKLVQRSHQRLIGAWALDDVQQLEYARVVLPRSQRPGDHRGFTYLSARSGFGQYLRRRSTFATHGERLRLDATAEIIVDLFTALKRAGLVEEVATGADGAAGYQVPASAFRWRAGDGTRPYRDPVRMPTAANDAAPPNEFFTDLYRNLATDLVDVEAREHTAQVQAEEREKRELRFRDATLPVLYCSPTMELGVDIAELNVVNMRNVPPTPANYSQRSGRAGRSGQPALVFTYCAAGSPHDQWYFQRPHLMVSGAVTPPRIDIANADLVRAHVHAVWLAECGLDLKSSLKDVLDVTPGVARPDLLASVRHHLVDATARERARQVAVRVLADLQPQLSAAPWWTPTWIEDVLSMIPAAFESATDRWRGLYRSAMDQFDRQNEIIRNAVSTQQQKNEAKRLRREAENQLALLTAEADTRTQSDFYSYRYFASEGFLPGYSFPRLPLSAYIPERRGRAGDGEYVSRPRFLAVSEFGPRALVYHEGARFEINRVILPVVETTGPGGEPVLTNEIKRCEACGYLHPLGADANPDLCERCLAPLPPPLRGMFRLSNVATRRRDRISSDEEERQRQGFELWTGFRFAIRNGRLSMRTAEVKAGDERLATLTYGDTGTLYRVNIGRRRRADRNLQGFVLDVDAGYWAREADEDSDVGGDDPTGPRTQRVIPFVEDSRNTLLMEPASPLSAAAMASVEAALKNAVQVEFQLEESELASEPLPGTEQRRLLLFYESAEGGAGVLRRLVDEPGALARVARLAIELCHVDPDTGHDLGGPDNREQCEAACYHCLMSYRNQLDHQLLDRKLAVAELQRFAAATVTAGAGAKTADEHVDDLKRRSDSGLEERWLDFLRRQGLRLPDRAQPYFESASTRPDFEYSDAHAVVYVDGPDHEYPERAARDAGCERAMRELGYRVIRFRYTDDWAQLVDTFRDVFGHPTPTPSTAS